MRRFVALLFFLHLSSPAFSAVASDTASAIKTIAYDGNAVWDHVCSGNSFLVVGVTTWDDGAEAVTVSSSLDGAFTLAKEKEEANARAALYYILNPTDGTHTITVSINNASSAFDSKAISLSVTGSDTTSPIEDDFSVAGTELNAVSGAITSSAGSMTIDLIHFMFIEGTVASGQILIDSDAIIGMSTKVEAASMGWDGATEGDDPWSYVGISLKVPDEAPPEPPASSSYSISGNGNAGTAGAAE